VLRHWGIEAHAVCRIETTRLCAATKTATACPGVAAIHRDFRPNLRPLPVSIILVEEGVIHHLRDGLINQCETAIAVTYMKPVLVAIVLIGAVVLRTTNDDVRICRV
jgi:hypothetical protein